MEKNAKIAPFFYKERKRMQRSFRSFIKNRKERKDLSILLKRTDAQPWVCLIIFWLDAYHINFIWLSTLVVIILYNVHCTYVYTVIQQCCGGKYKQFSMYINDFRTSELLIVFESSFYIIFVVSFVQYYSPFWNVQCSVFGFPKGSKFLKFTMEALNKSFTNQPRQRRFTLQ